MKMSLIGVKSQHLPSVSNNKSPDWLLTQSYTLLPTIFWCNSNSHYLSQLDRSRFFREIGVSHFFSLIFPDITQSLRHWDKSDVLSILRVLSRTIRDSWQLWNKDSPIKERLWTFLPISGALSDEEGRISLRISCITVTASSTVTLKPSFSPPLSEIIKEAKSRQKKSRMGSKKFTM